MTSMTQRSVEEVVAGPDPSWKGVYRAGGVSALLYVVLGMIVPAVLLLTSHYDASMAGDNSVLREELLKHTRNTEEDEVN